MKTTARSLVSSPQSRTLPTLGSVLTSWEVRQLVERIHPRQEDFAEGDLLARIDEHAHYEVRIVPLSRIEPVPFHVDEELVQEYLDLPEASIPPIVLGDTYTQGDHKLHRLTDGAHRLSVLTRREALGALALVPLD